MSKTADSGATGQPPLYFFDESEKACGDVKYCSLIAVKTPEAERLRADISDGIAEIIASPTRSQLKGINKDWIPHFCNDHKVEIHQTFLHFIAQMPFESYIAYARKDWLIANSERGQHGWYNHLLRQLLSFRLKAERSGIRGIIFEQHDSKMERRRSQIETVVRGSCGRSAQSIPVNAASKNELALCVCDYVGGAFMSYLCEVDPTQKHGAMKRKFETIEPKVRWIKNCETGRIYSRKTPFDGCLTL